VIPLTQHDPGAGPKTTTDAAGQRDLSRRVASALVLVPFGLITTYIGGWPFFAVCTIAAGIILWEWTTLAARSADPRILVPGIVALLAATVLGGEGEAGAAIGTIAIGAVIAAGFMAASPPRSPPAGGAFWEAGGVVYAGAALVSSIMLRNDPELGFAALLFLFATVWATDVFAYLAGRAFGGPLLWPQVSPNKTWSGAVGGLAGGVAAGGLVAYASGGTNPAVAGVLALVLSIVAQGGDLFESAVKRRFGAKDASSLIPGHGGAMDRLDGFIFAALAAVLIGIARDGMAAPARGLLVW
jgi:phosphatidate cytidylyltransferase